MKKKTKKTKKTKKNEVYLKNLCELAVHRLYCVRIEPNHPYIRFTRATPTYASFALICAID